MTRCAAGLKSVRVWFQSHRTLTLETGMCAAEKFFRYSWFKTFFFWFQSADPYAQAWWWATRRGAYWWGFAFEVTLKNCSRALESTCRF